MLLKSGKPIILCVNKVDSIGDTPAEVYEFYNLGLGDPIPVSSTHGHGTGDLLDEVLKHLPEGGREEDYATTSSRWRSSASPMLENPPSLTKLPGKSGSLSPTSPAPPVTQWTRWWKTKDGKFVFIDTAGGSGENPRFLKTSSVTAYFAPIWRWTGPMSVSLSSTRLKALLNRTARWQATPMSRARGCIVAVNKWDAVEDKTDKTMKEFSDKLRVDFSFMSYVPFLFISALTGQRVNKLYEMIKEVAERKNAIRVTTGSLNDLLAYATDGCSLRLIRDGG